MKRIMLILAAIFAMLALVSCGNEPKPERVTNVYRTSEITLPAGASVRESLSSPNGVALLGYDSEDGEYLRLVPELESLTVKSEPLGLSEGEGLLLTAIEPGGGLVCLTSSTDEQNQVTYRLSRTGETVVADLSVLFAAEGRGFRPRFLTVDTDGLIYVATYNSLACVTPDGETVAAFELEYELSELDATSDGKVLVGYSEGDRTKFSYLDLERRRYGEPFELPTEYGIYNAKRYFCAGADFCYSTDEMLYAYDLETQARTELCSYINSDLVIGSYRFISVLEPEKLLASDGEELLLLEKIPDDEVPEKLIVELAVVYTSPELVRTVVNFNRSSDKYRVVLRNYKSLVADDNPGGASELLVRDFLGDDPPDVVISTGFVKFAELEASGAFADLYPMLDSDADLTRESFFANILSGFERDGRLTSLPDDIMLETFVGSSDLPDSLTASSLVSLAESLPFGTHIFGESYTPENFLELILRFTLPELDDFTSPELVALLELAKSASGGYLETLTADERLDIEADVGLPYRENKVALEPVGFTQLAGYLEAAMLFGESLDVKTLGSTASARNSYAISDKSLVKSGAWELVKALVSDRFGKDGFFMGGFSPIREIFESELESELGGYCFFMADGGMRTGSGEYTPNPRHPEVGILHYIDEADLAVVRALMESAKPTSPLESELLALIREDAAAYFAGAKTSGETAAVIDDRASVMLAEKSR